MTEPEPDPCVCGAHMAEQLLPMLREASAAFAEVRQVIPTLAEVNRRLAVLERRPTTTLATNSVGITSTANDGHVHVFVDGFDRCSWCGVDR